MSSDRREHVVTVAGVRSPIVEVGPAGAREAVVFVHGNPGARADWSDLLGRVPAGVRAVAPDMPGFGAADAPEDFDYSVPGYGAHLEGVLRELGIDRAHFVLHDFGGPWGLELLARRPQGIASVVLINTGVFIDYSWHHFARIWRTKGVGEMFMALTNRPILVRLLGRENPRLSREHLDRLYDQIASKGTKRAVLRLYRATDPAQMEAVVPALRELDLPVLVVWGTDDRYLPTVQADHQRTPFPNARIEKLEGHGHWVYLEDPELVASHVVPWLAERTAAAAG